MRAVSIFRRHAKPLASQHALELRHAAVNVASCYLPPRVAARKDAMRDRRLAKVIEAVGAEFNLRWFATCAKIRGKLALRRSGRWRPDHEPAPLRAQSDRKTSTTDDAA